MPDARCQMPDARCWMLESGIWYLVSEIRSVFVLSACSAVLILLLLGCLGAASCRAAAQDAPPTQEKPPPEQQTSQPANQPTQKDELGEDEIELQTPGRLRRERLDGVTHWWSEGEVRLRSRNIKARADFFHYDTQRRTMLFGKRVQAEMDDTEVEGEWLEYNVDTRQWRLRRGRAKLAPALFESGVAAPLFVRSPLVQGTRREAEARGGAFTSCELDKPHYLVRVKRVRAITGDKIVFRKIRFVLGGQTLFTFPRYSISLKPTRRRETPVPMDFGQNSVDGFFIRTAYPYLATDDATGFLRLDLMSERGIGVGLEQDYQFKAGLGELFLYWLRDRQRGTEFDTRFRHEHRFGRTLSALLSFEQRKNTTFFARGFSTRVGELTLTHTTDLTNTRLSVRQQGFQGFGETKDTTYTLTHSFRAGSFSGELQSDWRQFDRGIAGEETDQELTNRLQLRQEGDILDFLLRYEQRVDLDSSRFTGDKAFFALDRLPELIVQSSRRRPLVQLAPNIPLNFLAAYGKFREQPEGGFLGRTDFKLEIPSAQMQLSRGISLLGSASFEQFLYSDNTAQYIYGLRTNIDFRFWGRSTMGFAYFLQNPVGFTPLRFDSLSDFESLDYRLLLEPSDRFRFNLSTGIDFQRSIFRDVIFSSQARPFRGTSFALSSGYDLERGELRDILIRWGMASPAKLLRGDALASFYPTTVNPYPLDEQLAPPKHGYRINLSARYIPRTGQLARIRGFIDYQIDQNLRFETLLGYNGFTKKFDFAQFRITKDLHCWQVSLTYNQHRNEFRLDLSLKAFPLFRPFFGRADNSQLADTSLGEIY